MTAAAMPWDWRDSAACLGHDSEMWFPAGEKSRDDLLQAAGAKAICATCPVQAECLADADGWGIRAGLTADERHTLRKRTQRQAREQRVVS